MAEKLVQIGHVLDAIKGKELAKLAEISVRHQAIANQLNELRYLRSQANKSILVGDNPVSWKASDNRILWIDKRIGAENGKLANVQAELEVQKLKAKIAIGKHEAFISVCDNNEN